ncbi:hypothetical protein BAY61_12000 [Prauserella marina]|uniref:Uncharacterized protein n=1 Tax=Prauserella marina TaxID=530584 RepID=A0A222VNV8_9PSEU|nr:hypothetical protein [Prauserella marina]ASR35600.1 hypothetical protein BAY61_12000 [Prauserella marina]PWV84543.1 hypothetical protein DES30_101560 [Prauserella marina]SDC19660.1 hypothetical protein SAMN05421630_101776 [Prauserella marina]
MNDFVWLHYTLPRTTWFELSTVERQALEAGFEECRQRSRVDGAELTGSFHVRGQSDYSHVEVWSFPSAEAAFDHWSRLVAAGYVRCFDYANQLGAADPAAGQNERNR